MNKKSKNQNRTRSLSRLMAIQIFYQHDFFAAEKKLEEVKKDVIENYVLESQEDISSYREKIDEEFLDKLLGGVALDVKKLDEEISAILKAGWTIEKLDDVMVEVLRFAAFELKFLKNIPTNTIINEYVDIAASFFDEKKVMFVNGVLDNLAKILRK